MHDYVSTIADDWERLGTIGDDDVDVEESEARGKTNSKTAHENFAAQLTLIPNFYGALRVLYNISIDRVVAKSPSLQQQICQEDPKRVYPSLHHSQITSTASATVILTRTRPKVLILYIFFIAQVHIFCIAHVHNCRW